MKKILLIITVILVCGAGGFGLWYLYQEQQKVTVVFSNVHGLNTGAGVWMSGMEIGKVGRVTMRGDGVEVDLYMKHGVREQLTENALFVIAPGSERTEPIVLAKPGSPGGKPLQKNAKIKGVNSYTLWQLGGFAEEFMELIDEPQVQEKLKELDDINKELGKKTDEVIRRLDELGTELGNKADEMMRNLGDNSVTGQNPRGAE